MRMGWQTQAIATRLPSADTSEEEGEETEEESADALDALERALGEAKKVAKSASTLVFGIEVPDEEQKPGSD